MPRYEYSDEKSNKFWEIELEGSSHTVRYGRIGTDGQTKTKSFDDVAAAEKDYDKMVKSKLKKGYELVGGGEAETPASTGVGSSSNPELEAALLENVENTEAWAVYADWLQAQGDPRGELAALQLALAGAPTASSSEQLARETALFAAHGAEWIPVKFKAQQEDHLKNKPKPSNSWGMESWERGGVELTWHAGFIKSARLGLGNDSSAVSLPELVADVLSHPSARFIQELTIGPLGEYPFEYDGVSKAIAAATLPCLRKLEHAQFSSEDTELSWSLLGDLSGIWSAAPNLATVELHGGSWELGDIDLPRAQSFTAHTGGLSADSIKSITAASWPSLTKLALLFGSDDYGAEGDIESIAGILDGAHFPALTDLGLMNSEFADDIAEALPKSAIAKRIERLDLSLGVLTGKGAALLADGASAFENLKALDVEDNYITDEAAAVLKAAFPFVHIGDQDKLDDLEEEDDEDEDDVWRYVSVGE